jgi:hypothetical protein
MVMPGKKLGSPFLRIDEVSRLDEVMLRLIEVEYHGKMYRQSTSDSSLAIMVNGRLIVGFLSNAHCTSSSIDCNRMLSRPAQRGCMRGYHVILMQVNRRRNSAAMLHCSGQAIYIIGSEYPYE